MQAPHTHAQLLVCAKGIIASAANAGWLNPFPCEPGEFLNGVATLPLGAGVIPVRVVENIPGVERLLEGIADEIASSTCLEHYIVLDRGFAPEHIGAVRASVQRTGRRVHAGYIDDYERWVAGRLGAIGRLGADAPMRHLLERFFQYSGKSEPTKKYTWNVDYKKGSNIETSFRLGARGSQAIATLFAHVMGAAFMTNVESFPKYQKLGIDFNFQCALGGRFGDVISADIKTEKIFLFGTKIPTKNLSLELLSNLEANNIGWFLNPKTAMAILISINWLTGDVWLVSFPQLLRWYEAGGKKSLRETNGWVEGQNYHSRIALLPVKTLFGEFDGDAFHLNLRDWIGKAYQDQQDRKTEAFAYPSVMPPQFSSRTLMPQV